MDELDDGTEDPGVLLGADGIYDDADDETLPPSEDESDEDFENDVLKLCEKELAVTAAINESYESACSRLTAALGAGQLSGRPGAVDVEKLDVVDLQKAVREAEELQCHDPKSRQLLATATVARDARGPRPEAKTTPEQHATPRCACGPWTAPGRSCPRSSAPRSAPRTTPRT